MQGRKSAYAGVIGALAVSGLVSCAGTLAHEPGMRPLSAGVGICTAAAVGTTVASVAWIAPADPAPKAWCEAVGPPRLEMGSLTAPGARDSLVVVSWNVRAGAGDLAAFLGDLRGGALTGRPEDQFVLLLQEAYRAGTEVPVGGTGRLTSRIGIPPPGGRRTDVAEIAAREGLYLFYAPSMPNGTAGPSRGWEDRGNAILSTYPLEELTAIELPFEVQRRVAVAATITSTTTAGDPWMLRIASGHLDTRSPWGRFADSFGAGRARQASALAEALGGESVLLGADLNTWSAAFLEDALPILRSSFPHSPTVEAPTFVIAGLLPRRLDHILARLPDDYRAEARRLPHRYGSDHFPLLAVVRVPSSAAEGVRIARLELPRPGEELERD